jgi:hypothetical protein
VTDEDRPVDVEETVEPVDTAKNLEDWKWEGGDAQQPGSMADAMAVDELQPAKRASKSSRPRKPFAART